MKQIFFANKKPTSVISEKIFQKFLRERAKNVQISEIYAIIYWKYIIL
jgi:hypothetical protein